MTTILATIGDAAYRFFQARTHSTLKVEGKSLSSGIPNLSGIVSLTALVRLVGKREGFGRSLRRLSQRPGAIPDLLGPGIGRRRLGTEDSRRRRHSDGKDQSKHRHFHGESGNCKLE